MQKICKYGKLNGKTTELCDNRDLFRKLKEISADRAVPFDLMIGITYAESHIGVNYRPAHCSVSNNRSGIKWKVYDDNKKGKRLGDAEKGCRVENFESVEQFRMSFANSLNYGYIKKNCKTAECISKRWVKGDGITSPSWNNRVNIFKY